MAFQAEAFAHFTAWAKTDPKLHEWLPRSETTRKPFTGLGKPEPLRHQLKGCWSRRIDDEHRLVYRVTEDALTILSCRDYY